MNDDKLRHKIAIEAARLMVHRQETDLGRARIRAARRLRGWVKPARLPSETEIRDEIERLSYVGQGDARFDNLRELRLTALEIMRLLSPFHPRIVGAAVQGDARSVSTIELTVEADSLEEALALLPENDFDAPSRIGEQVQLAGRIPVEISGRSQDDPCGILLEEFEQLLTHEYPDLNLDENLDEAASQLDRFQVYRMLLAPLAQVQQSKAIHPEGDALYHSLQVFQLAQQENPYDEELLLAALLHDVGKGIDPIDHVRATLDALAGYITERTAWLIENLHDARRILEHTIGARARRRLHQHPDYEDLLTLARCDRAGRVSGAAVPELDEALETIRELARTYG